jgi:MerR family transcriptional regulator, light-induced transcriptional regulator
MEGLYDSFLKYLLDEDKEKCVKIALSAVEEGSLTIPELYTGVLANILNNIRSHNSEKHLAIWQEHIRSAIIRTIIECCYPYIMRQVSEIHKGRFKAKVAIICPDGELHELGARMAADFFSLEGYKVYFVGSSTPYSEFLAVIDHVKPDYIALSITNFYNIVSAKKTIIEIRRRTTGNLKILAGGSALRNKPQLVKDIGADAYIDTYRDIQCLQEGVYEE